MNKARVRCGWGEQGRVELSLWVPGSPVAEGLLLADRCFAPLVSFVPSQTTPSIPSVLIQNFLGKQLLWERAPHMTGYCVLDTGNLGELAASWVWPTHRSAGLLG